MSAIDCLTIELNVPFSFRTLETHTLFHKDKAIMNNYFINETRIAHYCLIETLKYNNTSLSCDAILNYKFLKQEQYIQ